MNRPTLVAVAISALMALTFALLELRFALDADESGRPRLRLAALACFAASLLSKTSLVALQEVPESGWFGRMIDSILMFFYSLFH